MVRPGSGSPSTESPLFAHLPDSLDVWMSHGDHVAKMPDGFTTIGQSDNAPCAAIARDRVVAIQFHPEVAHTPLGKVILRNFLTEICGIEPTWTPASFVEHAIEQIRAQVGTGRVLLGLSGGVDSSVAAALIHRAIGEQLTPVFVNNGLLRLGEADLVQDVFARAFGMNLVYADATDAVPRAAGRCHRSRAEAEDDRRDVHPRLRGRGGEGSARSSSWPRARSIQT